jgi:transcriptional regulator with XRE-family HTH domain
MIKKNSNARSRFAQRLRAIRIPRGYKTARSFAEALEIDENRYTRYERAEVEPDLQLLMRICGLLDATPNDLLCDTIGMSPIEMEMPFGFAERAGGGYQTGAAPTPSSADATRQDEAFKAAAWELASVVAAIEAEAAGINSEAMPYMEKLRKISPIHARMLADVFAFFQELPERLKGVTVSPEMEKEMARLMQTIIAIKTPASNDN